jgi:hypothetical protein
LAPARHGYARFSTEDQNLELQLAALKKVGCKRVFTDKISGANANRSDGSKAMDHIKALQQIYAYVEAGDVGNAVMGCLRVAKSTPQSKRRAR